MASSSEPFDLMLRKLTTHVALDEADRSAVMQLPIRRRTVDAGSYLVREGEAPEQCAVLVTGFAFRHKLTDSGGRQIVSLHIPGEAVDFQNLFLDVADHNVQTLTRADIAVIPRADIQALTQARPRIAHAVLVSILVEASIFREWILNVGRRDSRAALAHLLCEFAIRLESQGLLEEYAYELPMTQEQLGDALGLTSVHVNRTMKALEADGLITRSNRRIRFPNWKALREVAGFNARYLHLTRQPEMSGRG